MFINGEKSHLCQNDETFICSNLYKSAEPINDQNDTIKYSEFPAITKITPTNNVPEILSQAPVMGIYTPSVTIIRRPNQIQFP